MPSVSKAQHKAMAASCTGGGTSDIPQSVGCDFMHSDKGKVSSMPERKAPKKKLQGIGKAK